MGTATNLLFVLTLETNPLSLKRIGWLYPIFRDVHFHHGLLSPHFQSAACRADLVAAFRVCIDGVQA